MVIIVEIVVLNYGLSVFHVENIYNQVQNYCPNCGSKLSNEENIKFCEECGEKL